MLSFLLLSVGAPPRRPSPGPTVPLPEGTKVLKDLAYVAGGHERQKLDLYLPPTGTALAARRVDPRRRVPDGQQGRRAVPLGGRVRRARLRGGGHQLPAEPARRLPGADRGLQGRRALAARERGALRLRPVARRLLRRLRGRPPRRDARDDRRREGVRRGRAPRPVEPRAGRGRLLRPDRLPADGRPPAERAGDGARHAGLARSRSSSAAPSATTRTRWRGPTRSRT